MKLIILTFLFTAHLVFAQNKSAEEKKNLIATAEAVVETKIRSGSFELLVQPIPGTHLNFEGPWKLVLDGEIPVADDKFKTLKTEDFDRTKNRFIIPLNPKASLKKISGHYKLDYFLCGDDNSWCKRSQKTGTF